MRRRQVLVDVRKGVGRTVKAPAPPFASASQMNGRQVNVFAEIVVPAEELYEEM